jgi:hypothetical protein
MALAILIMDREGFLLLLSNNINININDQDDYNKKIIIIMDAIENVRCTPRWRKQRQQEEGDSKRHAVEEQ